MGIRISRGFCGALLQTEHVLTYIARKNALHSAQALTVFPANFLKFLNRIIIYYKYNYIGKFIKWHRAHRWQQTRTSPTLQIKLALRVLSYCAKMIIYNCQSSFNSCLNPFI